MEGHGEVAADVITGAVVGRALEPNTGATSDEHESHGTCLNCGALLTGVYCSNCGQPAHLHRTLGSLFHDILHGVFHFEGKVWRTIPELFFRPGRLTRRYIDGERAKFISPMALYLFTVFLTFAIFSFTSHLSLTDELADSSPAQEWQNNINDQIEAIDDKTEALNDKLENPNLDDAGRAKVQKDIADLKATRDVMDAMVKGDPSKFAEFQREQAAREAADDKGNNVLVNTSNPKLNDRLNNAFKEVVSDPKLMMYKLKTTAYKYSWALIPLSVPFMWMLFFWRRDIHLYDHAIFVTYSISFMMLFACLLSILSTVTSNGFIIGTALVVAPSLHLYKQLRGAYAVSRFGAFVRLFLLSIMISVVLTLFAILLAALGALG